MQVKQHKLVESIKHIQGKYGGFCFGGQKPDGVYVRNVLPRDTVFPNGAKSAILLTFDAEGTYGNGKGDMQIEIANYKRICKKLSECDTAATFNVVGQMAQEQGPEFVEWMFDARCEVASHGYWHDMNKFYGGEYIYAGHYDIEKNYQQIRRGIDAIEKIRPGSVRGIRLPYGHFNEYSYDAMVKCGLVWASNVGADDLLYPENGFGSSPFQIKLGQKLYPLVEIPLDSQTYDWAIWIADEANNAEFVKPVKAYCRIFNLPFDRTPAGAVNVWMKRISDAIKLQTVFTLLCHPINLTIKSNYWKDAVEEFLFPVIDYLRVLQKDRVIWVCTCNKMAEFYNNFFLSKGA
jgi:peptidoglycan/xylan/chitin deacetylase (PgdA/CDA1 family)